MNNLDNQTEALWFERPLELLSIENLKKFVWLPNMSYNQRQNALVRFMLYLTIIGYGATGREAFIYLFIFSLALLYYLHHNQREQLVRLIGSSNTLTNYSQIGGGADGSPHPQTPCQSIEQWKTTYGSGAPFEGYANRNIDRNVVIDPATNQICKVSTMNNPFGNSLPGDSIARQSFPVCDPSAQKAQINHNFNQNLFSDLNDVWQRNNSQRQYITENSTTIPNDRESFMKWAWETPFVCKDGDLDVCFKQGY